VKHFGIVHPRGSGLATLGALIEVTIRPAPAIREAMRFDGDEPGEIKHKLLIDTGAHRTLIAREIAEALDLDPIRLDPIVGVSQKVEEWPVYRMGIEINVTLNAGDKMRIEADLEVAGSPPFAESEKHVGLLGRDFLADWLFFYDGLAGRFMLKGGPEGDDTRVREWRKAHPAPKKAARKRL
jgi:hypothetical protein